ncbi:hypothetical protein J132_10178 [Termitomyces sp. J132]|nr:hypothetical protein J132_10178 [Termitomyces sp. J132]
MANLTSQLEKITMAHAFLNWVNYLLTVACASLAKDSRLAVTAIFQMWLQWFKTTGSGVEWPELATAPVNPSLEFLMDDLTTGMMLFEDLSLNDQFFFQHPVGALVVARGEEWSEGHEGKETVNRGDIQEVGPLTPKAAAGGIARGLATTPRSKEKGKAQEEEGEDIEEQIEETFTNKCLAILLHWRKALTVVDMGLEARVVLKKAKGKVTVSLEKQQEYKHMQGACNNCWANNDPEGC